MRPPLIHRLRWTHVIVQANSPIIMSMSKTHIAANVAARERIGGVIALFTIGGTRCKMRKPCEEDLLIEGTGWFCRLPDGHIGLHVAIGRDEKGREYAITWSSEIKEIALSEEGQQ